MKDEDAIDLDSIDRACAEAAEVDLCCFCGREIKAWMPIDRETSGRTAHYRCSESHYLSGEWQMAVEPVFGIVEDDEDERALYWLLGA